MIAFNNKYLISRLWVSPMENRDTDGYEPYAVADTEEQVKAFLDENQKFYGKERCWSLPDNTPLYIYKEIKSL